MSEKKTRRFSFSVLMQSRKFLSAASVVLALAVWWSVMSSAFTTSDRTLSIPYTVDLTGSLAEQIGLRLVDDVSADVNVVVDGPWAVVSKLTAEDLRIRADLSTIQKSGKQKIQLSVSRNSAEVDYDIVSYYPDSLEVSCDYWATRTLTLETDVKALSVSDGKTMKLGAPVLDAAVADGVVLSGPKTEMDKVDRLVATVEEEAVLADVQTFTAVILAYNADGDLVDISHCGVEGLTDLTVPVTVPVNIEQTVRVGYDLLHAPTAYSDSKNFAVLSPSQLTLTGTAGALAALGGKISLGTLDFDTLRPDESGSCVIKTNLTLPDGVTVGKDSQIEVTATVLRDLTTKQVSFVSNSSNTAFRELSANQTATLHQRYFTVTLVGPEAALEELTADDLTAAVTLGKTGDGRAEGTLRFAVSGANNVWVYYGTAGGTAVTATVTSD